MSIKGTFERIDAIRSIKNMRAELNKLTAKTAREVVLLALRESEFQHTWGFFAEQFRVPKRLRPKIIGCSRWNYEFRVSIGSPRSLNRRQLKGLIAAAMQKVDVNGRKIEAITVDEIEPFSALE
jgi:hypothetical protein